MKNRSNVNSCGVTSCLVERQISSEQALHNIRQIIASHGLESQVECAGSDLKSYHVFLFDRSMKKEFIGCGKGVGVQSEVSALFEAFEHYMSYQTLHRNDQHFKMKVYENPDLDYLINEHMLPPNFVKLIGGADVMMPWVRFYSMLRAASIFYPLFLIEPKYNRGNRINYDESTFFNLSHLSSGSGCASGSSFDEAFIHGVLEAIERDAHSLFLYNAFIRNKQIDVVEKDTVPDYLKRYIKAIENEYNDELVIIDITSNVGVPCFCVTFTKSNAAIQPKGYGASLYKAYALERALLESLQPVHLRTKNQNKAENNTINRLKKYPLLQLAAVADVNAIIQADRFRVIDFTMIKDFYAGESLAEQKHKLLSLLEKRGFHTYCNNLYTLPNYSLVQILVSRFSNLFLLHTGKLILPNVSFLNSRMVV